MSNPNDARNLLGKMRNLKNNTQSTVQEYTAKGNNAGKKKEMSMRDMLAITRKKRLVEADMRDYVTPVDKQEEEQKMENYFGNDVTIDFDDLIVRNFDDVTGVWFGGVMNGVLKWQLMVSSKEELNKIDIELLENPIAKSDDTNNVSSIKSIEELTEKLKAYYNKEFKPYWIQNKIQK